MTQDARERAKWKVRLSGWVDGLPALIKRPVKKLILETTFGILSSGTLKQSEIARALKEPCRLHHTQKRISRMLARHSEVSWAAEQLQLRQIAPLVTEDMILAIDPGDLNRAGAPKSELRGRVRIGHLWMVVVRHGKREPLVLVTTRPVRGRRQGERLIHSYLDRWACEEGCRFSKQGFDLEGVQARRFTTLQNLVALASLAWALLAAYQEDGNRLLEKAQRQKSRRSQIFPFYNLLAGWQRLFSMARVIFHPWLRRRQHSGASPPPQPDLFANAPGLLGAIR